MVNLPDSKDPIAIIGWHEGSAGQIHSWLEKCSSYRIVCFVHPGREFPDVVKTKRAVSQFSYPENGQFKSLPLLSAIDWPDLLKSQGIDKVLVTLVTPSERAREMERALAAGLELVNAIHPTATVMDDAVLGKNVILHARSFVGYRAELGNGVIVNSGAQVDHHCRLGSCVTVDPAVIMAGNVSVEENSHLHTGAIVKNSITIGKNSIVGAGAVVIRDVNSGDLVVGVPARPLTRTS